MAEKEKQYSIKELAESLSAKQNTEWHNKKVKVSENIRKALIEKIEKMNAEDADKGKKYEEKSYNARFIEYCSSIKALLIIYNFGERLEESRKTEDKDIEDKSKDKELIRKGIYKIIEHVSDKVNYGFDLSPSVENTEFKDIFSMDGRLMPVTSTAALVFTTLIYFRRAVKRRNLMSSDEWESNFSSRVTQLVAEILLMFYNYTYTDTDDKDIKEQNFRGWGVTLDKDYTKVVTLSDTYTVIEAISRFADACLQVDDEKLDVDFVNAIDEIGRNNGIENLSARSEETTFKVATNIYSSASSARVYGKSVFYVSEEAKRKGKIDYIPTSYEQVASSSRSSALFNPLYVAMITMYGYTDKEVVIAKVQDDYELAKSLYNKYYKDYKGKNSLYDYYFELREKDSKKFYAAKEDDAIADSDLSDEEKHKNFEEYVKILLKEHGRVSKMANFDIRLVSRNNQDDGENISWRQYYNAARLFQKYLEKYHPEELLNIQEYKDYLNSTKDAIDQVQIMYRDFDRNQRLGIVDTDYATFTQADVLLKRDINLAALSRLNKANISLYNLRPLLLSSKILIVNALTKYPSFDMAELYDSIIDSQYKKRVIIDEKTTVKNAWLWNADGIDMKSTASHCDSLMYDYFDYYDNYEIGFKTATALNKEIKEYLRAKTADSKVGMDIDEKNLDISFTKDEGTSAFVELVLQNTEQNVSLIKERYRNVLTRKDEQIGRMQAQWKEERGALEKEIESLKAQIASVRGEEQAKFEKILEHNKETYEVGKTLRSWIDEGVENYLKNAVTMMVVKSLNNAEIDSDNSDMLKELLENGALLPKNEIVKEYWKKIEKDIASQPTEELKREKLALYNDKIESSNILRKGLEMSTNGIIDQIFTDNLSELDAIKKLDKKLQSDKITNMYSQKKKSNQAYLEKITELEHKIDAIASEIKSGKNDK